jgi:hypothetical protein
MKFLSACTEEPRACASIAMRKAPMFTPGILRVPITPIMLIIASYAGNAGNVYSRYPCSGGGGGRAVHCRAARVQGARAHTRALARACAPTHADTPTHARTRTLAHARTHARTRAAARTRTLTHAHTRARPCRTQALTRLASERAPARAQGRAHTHTRARARAWTHEPEGRPIRARAQLCECAAPVSARAWVWL